MGPIPSSFFTSKYDLMLKTGPILQIQILLKTLSTIQMGKLFDAEMASNLAAQPVFILHPKP